MCPAFVNQKLGVWTRRIIVCSFSTSVKILRIKDCYNKKNAKNARRDQESMSNKPKLAVWSFDVVLISFFWYIYTIHMQNSNRTPKLGNSAAFLSKQLKASGWVEVPRRKRVSSVAWACKRSQVHTNVSSLPLDSLPDRASLPLYFDSSASKPCLYMLIIPAISWHGPLCDSSTGYRLVLSRTPSSGLC